MPKRTGRDSARAELARAAAPLEKYFCAGAIFLRKYLTGFPTALFARPRRRSHNPPVVTSSVRSRQAPRNVYASICRARSLHVVPRIASKNVVLETIMESKSFTNVSDRDLLEATSRAAADERHATVDLIELLGEIDARRLYLSEGCASLFVFCTRELKLSEHEAYHRIEAARAARVFPVILDHLRDGALTLTSVTLLRPHLTPHNADALITAALAKPKREVERQMAAIAPKPDVNSMVRRLPTPSAAPPVAAVVEPTPALAPPASLGPSRSEPPSPEPRPLSTPLSSDRYLLRVTLGAEAHANLQRARDLMRHSVPNGDPAEIVERALELLVADLERRRVAHVSKPRETASETGSVNSRHVPASVKREVWTRDQGRCAFVGRKGRCRETGGLEFHHVHAFALGGETSAANLELRCRAHNQYEGELLFGPRPERTGDATATVTRPGPS